MSSEGDHVWKLQQEFEDEGHGEGQFKQAMDVAVCKINGDMVVRK